MIANPKINDVYLEEQDSEVFLTVEHADQSKYSAVLRSKSDPSEVNLAPTVIDTIKTALATWAEMRVKFAEKYIQDDRKEIEFLHDVIALSKYVSELPAENKNLLEFSEGTLLMHNRVIAQMLYEYHSLGYDVDPMPDNSLGGKIHDFNVSKFRCEVKTIQILGELERTANKTIRLSSACERSLLLKIKENLDYATTQVGNNGIIIFAPWSYRLNSVLRSYFKNKLSLYPPALQHGMTVLVLTSNRSFQDFYIWFPSSQASLIFENIFSMIQRFGVEGFSINYIREGITIRATTAPVAGSSAGFIFQPEPWW